LLVTVPAHPRLWSVVDEVSGHKRRYTKASLSRVLESAGLTIRLVRPFNVALLPLQVLQRWSDLRQLSKNGVVDPRNILNRTLRVPPPWANTLLRWASRADCGLAYMPAAFGASLVAVAQAK
jgi:hypothetical protein